MRRGPAQTCSAHTVRENRRTLPIILLLILCATPLYVGLGLVHPRDEPLLWLSGHALLILAMLGVWKLLPAGRAAWRAMLVGALLFRVASALVGPTLSDDVYRYVWDGRVQLAGVHPYRYAPDAPELESLRDASWSHINHPELHTIYPPLSELLFTALAACGAGAPGFKMTLGLLDFGVVLALYLVLCRLRLPHDRLVLYAWNPLAVVETAGNGHVEPLGVGLVLLSVGWILTRRRTLSTLALAGAVLAKLLPLVLLPGQLRRAGPRNAALLALALLSALLPYAWYGPAIGPGLIDYAERWEHNSIVYAGLERGLSRLELDRPLKAGIAVAQGWIGGDAAGWEFLYRHVWPTDLARLVVATLALVWLVLVARRWELDPARSSFLALGGVLLLSPTLHPWYLLWVLPFAAVFLSWPWLALAALVPLSYLTEDGGVGWYLRTLQFGPPLVIWLALRRYGTRRAGAAAGHGPG